MTAVTSRVLDKGYSGNPWNALSAMMIGFFMIMLDSTIVSIANPTIMAELHIGYADVVWVTSAYLLGYAVVLLVAGRLGDRFGPKNLYLIGLSVFTAASMWCGLAGTAAMLIAARTVQGIGAGLLTPQTLSTITRIFPATRRGAALSLWGAAAGVASLVGPLIGGVLVSGLGWEWIFFVNIPIGLAGLVVAYLLVPDLPVHAQRFDLIGVGLSGAGMFLLVFGLQEGQAADWAPWIWAVLVAGVGFMAMFVYWQALNHRAPLISLAIFRDWEFSLCNIGVGITAFATTAPMLPLTFYAQSVCGLSPARAAVLIAPVALASGVLAPVVGMLVDRSHPLPVLGFGFSALAISMTWLSIEMVPETPVWRLVLPFAAMGAGMAFVWSPLAATATRNLPAHLAGAGSGVYNATRKLGAVLGSASMAAFMTWRITAEMPPGFDADRGFSGGDGGLQLPEVVCTPFSAAMSQSMLLPAFIAVFGIIAALFLVRSRTALVRAHDRASHADDDHVDRGDYGYGDYGEQDDFGEQDDYDDYVEFVLRPEPAVGTHRHTEIRRPLSGASGNGPAVAGRGQQPHSARFEKWRDDAADGHAAPIEHNGARVDARRRFRPVADFLPAPDQDDAAGSGHSLP
ncbi:drug-transport integral membrane protein [Mycobacterium liflandii 128FXT]|uniref:Drug-transport integral membrane protein n=1 Tax=Mycobacterium liflandii (strain 128FXT) TaxID=459424 RepID=L7VEW9_MYCL1|nr:MULTISPECIES: MFS transporter [Mycobacterium ulcerans group]AGC63934.1 drug-transport integral membrane protein [Mycobacterium liflandii 128FXT]